MLSLDPMLAVKTASLDRAEAKVHGQDSKIIESDISDITAAIEQLNSSVDLIQPIEPQPRPSIK